MDFFIQPFKQRRSWMPRWVLSFRAARLLYSQRGFVLWEKCAHAYWSAGESSEQWIFVSQQQKQNHENRHDKEFMEPQSLLINYFHNFCIEGMSSNALEGNPRVSGSILCILFVKFVSFDERKRERKRMDFFEGLVRANSFNHFYQSKAISPLRRKEVTVSERK